MITLISNYEKSRNDKYMEEQIQSYLGENIRRFLKERGYTQQQLADKVGISRVYLSDLIRGKKGKRIPQKTLNKIAQALGVSVAELLEEPNPEIPPKLERIIRKAKFLPVIGAVRAGNPQSPIEYKYTEKFYPYVGELPCKAEDCFVLEVDGNSMYPTLKDGDYVLIKPIEKYPMLIPENFENKIVLVANDSWEYTLKRLKKIDGQWLLIPDNPDYEILKPGEEWKVLGVALERLPKPERL